MGRTVVLRITYPNEIDKSGIVVVRDYDIYLHATPHNANLDMWWRDKNAAAQSWIIGEMDGCLTFQNKQTGRFLEVRDGRIWSPIKNSFRRNKLWNVKHVGGGACSIQSNREGTYLCGSLKGMSMWDWVDLWHQKWAIIDEDVIHHWEKEGW